MKRIMIILLLTLAVGAFGQSYDEYIIQGKEKIQSAINDWDHEKMLDARAHFERVLAQGKMEWLTHYYIAYCDYRLTTYMFSKSNMKGAKNYVNDGIENLIAGIELNAKNSEAYVLLSSFYGNKIAIIPWTGFWYGPKAGKLMQQATEFGKDNPRVHLLQGLSFYFTPERWGGSKQKAKGSFIKAIELYQNEKKGTIYPDWGYSETYGWLGSVEVEFGDKDTAKAYFDKALEINPNNNWVKYQLSPKVKE